MNCVRCDKEHQLIGMMQSSSESRAGGDWRERNNLTKWNSVENIEVNDNDT